MRKSFSALGIILLAVFLLPKTSFALSMGFGGKIMATTISGVTCTGGGTLVILDTNASGAVSAVSSAASKGSTTSKVYGTISSIYKMIPFYATDLSKKPQKGGHIIGKADSIIDTGTCKYKSGDSYVPVPVRKTSKYAISPDLSKSTSNYGTTSSAGIYNYE